MSLLKHILSPFVEFKEGDKPATPLKENAAQKQEYNSTPANVHQPPHTMADAIPVQVQPAPRAAIPPNTRILPEHQQYFENLMEDANAKNPIFQGTDFKEFIDSKIDVDAIADEPTKYRTAFNVLKRTGLTRERLLSTGQEYINIIGREMNAFQSAHSQQYQKDVKQKELLLQKKAEELKALNDRIAALNQEIGKLSQEVVQTKDTLNAAKNSFLLAGENKQQEINSELQKIAQYF